MVAQVGEQIRLALAALSPDERMTLAFWVSYAAAELAPLAARLRELLFGSVKLAVDGAPVPVLDPGRGRTKIGYFWLMARDDRPSSNHDPRSTRTLPNVRQSEIGWPYYARGPGGRRRPPPALPAGCETFPRSLQRRRWAGRRG